jgi:hypothetical protein
MQHRRVIEPLATASARFAEEEGERLPEDPFRLATARFAMQLGLQLERLTQPEVVDDDFSRRMATILMNGGADGLSD